MKCLIEQKEKEQNLSHGQVHREGTHIRKRPAYRRTVEEYDGTDEQAGGTGSGSRDNTWAGPVYTLT